MILACLNLFEEKYKDFFFLWHNFRLFQFIFAFILFHSLLTYTSSIYINFWSAYFDQHFLYTNLLSEQEHVTLIEAVFNAIMISGGLAKRTLFSVKPLKIA